MKLRTVLSELKVTDCVTGADVKLDGDVIVHPAALPEVSFPELLILASEGESVVPEGFEGTVLVYEGQTLPDGVERRLARRIVHVASNLDRDAFARGFARLPELHMHLDMQRNRLFEAFQNSYDIQRFADRACEILGNPLLVVNSDGCLLASAGDFSEDPAVVLETINRSSVSEGLDARLKREEALEDGRTVGYPVISQDEQSNQRWAATMVMRHHLEMGLFVMLEQDRPIREADLELVDFAGSLAGIMIDRLGVAGKRAGSGSTVLDDLLGATFISEKAMRAQLALSSMPLDETYVLVELAGDREIPRTYLQRVAVRASSAFRNTLWTMRDDRLVLLIALGARTCPGWDGYNRAERVLGQRKEFVSTLNRNGLRAFVSEPFERLSLAPDRYQQIRDLMAAHVPEDGSIVFFWQHRYRVLASMARTFCQVDMMLDKRVIAMNLYDFDHHTSYLETARMTVEFPGSPAEAAKALNVHRNTYFYRVNKIAELFFLDLRRGDDRLAVAFSTRFLKGMDNRLLFEADQAAINWQQAISRIR